MAELTSEPDTGRYEATFLGQLTYDEFADIFGDGEGPPTETLAWKTFKNYLEVVGVDWYWRSNRNITFFHENAAAKGQFIEKVAWGDDEHYDVYASGKPVHSTCPKCGEEVISDAWSQPQVEGDQVWQETYCENDHRIVDVYEKSKTEVWYEPEEE